MRARGPEVIILTLEGRRRARLAELSEEERASLRECRYRGADGGSDFATAAACALKCPHTCASAGGVGC